VVRVTTDLDFWTFDNRVITKNGAKQALSTKHCTVSTFDLLSY
jgi:hypothetical protein